MRQLIQRILGIDAASHLSRLQRAGARSQRVPADWQSCSVYSRDEQLFIVCGSRRQSGVIEQGVPVRTAPRSASAMAIGAAVLDVMSHSKTGRPDGASTDPTPWHATVGFRSWRTFAAGCRCVGVGRADGAIRAYGTDGDPQGGFLQRPSEQDCVVAPSPEEVGAAVLRLLESSTPVPSKKGRSFERTLRGTE